MNSKGHWPARDQGTKVSLTPLLRGSKGISTPGVAAAAIIYHPRRGKLTSPPQASDLQRFGPEA